MIELSPEVLTVAMFGLLILFVMVGYPLGFVLGAIGLIIGFLTEGVPMFEITYLRLYGAITTYTFLAAPLFILMGLMMERSGVTDSLFEALHI